MKVEALFLLFLGVFFGLVGLVYWFTSYDDGGGMMLLGTSLLGFLPGLYYFFWHRRFHGHKYFFWGTVHAAIRSGLRAAQQILASSAAIQPLQRSNLSL